MSNSRSARGLEVLRSALERLVDDRMGVAVVLVTRRRTLHQVLIDAERLVELPERLLEPMHDAAARRDRGTRRRSPPGDRRRRARRPSSGTRGRRRSPTARGGRSDVPGLAMVLEDACEPHHRRSSITTSTCSCFAASYRRRCRDRTASRIWSICGSCCVLHSAKA